MNFTKKQSISFKIECIFIFVKYTRLKFQLISTNHNYLRPMPARDTFP